MLPELVESQKPAPAGTELLPVNEVVLSTTFDVEKPVTLPVAMANCLPTVPGEKPGTSPTALPAGEKGEERINLCDGHEPHEGGNRSDDDENCHGVGVLQVRLCRDRRRRPSRRA